MVRVNVDLSTELADALQARCERRGNSRNAELLLAVRAYLAAEEPASAPADVPPLRRPPPRASARANPNPHSASPWRKQRHSVPAQHALRGRE